MAGQVERRFHESTSRALSRLAFLALGGFPVAACICFCMLQYLPGYQRWMASGWEASLEEALGVRVNVTAVEPLSPSRSVLHGVRIGHPETDATMARARQVEVEKQAGQWLIRIGQAEVEGRFLGESCRLLHNSVLCRPQRALAAVVSVDEVILHLGKEKSVVRSVLSKVFPGPQSTLMNLDFELSRGVEGTGEPTRLLVKRSHEETLLMTRAQLRTGAPLPCSLAALIWPEAEMFGPAASFDGVLDFALKASGWELNVERQLVKSEGQTDKSVGGLLLSQVDFGRLSWDVSDVHGEGGLWLDRAHVTSSGIVNLSGAVEIGPGRVSRGLLTALDANVGIALSETVLGSTLSDVSFEKALFQFQIAPSSLWLVGALPGGGLLADSNGSNLAVRSTDRWSMPVPLRRLVDAVNLSHVPSPSTSNDAGPKGGKLARFVGGWLPLETAAVQAAQNGLRLSDTH